MSADNCSGCENEVRAAWLAKVAQRKRAFEDRCRIAPPTGDYYEAEVPDTLDLADRGALAVNALTAPIEPEQDYLIYDYLFYDTDPAHMTGPLGNIDCGKTLEAQPQARLMSGTAEGLENQRQFVLQVLAQTEDNGIFFTAPKGTQPWVAEKYQDAANVCIIGRSLRAMVYHYEYDGNPLWLEEAGKIFRTLKDELLTYCDGRQAYDRLVEEVKKHGGEPVVYPAYVADRYAYFRPGLPGWGFLPRGGYPPDTPDRGAFLGSHVITVAYNLLGVARYARATGDPEAIELARLMANTLRSPEFYRYTGYGWDDTPGIFGPDRLHFSTGCHFQATLMFMQALLEYAKVARDVDLMEQVRSGYEWFRNFGLADLGYFPESPTASNGECCCPAGMLVLAILLSREGVGDYWEDADRYVRNAVTEYQLVDGAQLQASSKAGSAFDTTHISQNDDRVIERTLGSWAMHPYVTQSPMPVGCAGGECCTQNGAQALYLAWESIVQDKGDDTAEINLLLNRAAAQLDVDSYLPYEGKVVIRNKTARRIFVRMPNWIAQSEVRCSLNGGELPFSRIGKYVLIEGVRPGDRIALEFPVSERTIKRTLAATEQTYAITYRGNTVVDIAPRDEDSPQGVANGALVLNRAGYYLVNGLDLKDGSIAVEVETEVDFAALTKADPGFELGVVFRHQGNWDCLHGVLGYPFYGIGIRKLPEETMYAGTHSATPAEKLGSRFTLEVRMRGTEIVFTVTDGSNTYTSEYTAPDEFDAAGGVGLHIGARTGVVVRFSSFRVLDCEGNTVFEDKLDDEARLLDNWRGINSECRYLYFQRDHLRKNEAPMVKKTRFVPDHLISR